MGVGGAGPGVSRQRVTANSLVRAIQRFRTLSVSYSEAPE